jgi:hypothetical protein
MALFIDKSKDGMDVIPLWKELFPHLRHDIETAWIRMEPAWNLIRSFRDRAGFHADKPNLFFHARSAVLTNQELVTKALDEFEKLQRKVLAAESNTLPDFEEVVDALLDELEAKDGHKYQRNEFKRYLMIAKKSE